jgi:hypothetical protein
MAALHILNESNLINKMQFSILKLQRQPPYTFLFSIVPSSPFLSLTSRHGHRKTHLTIIPLDLCFAANDCLCRTFGNPEGICVRMFLWRQHEFLLRTTVLVFSFYIYIYIYIDNI